MSSFGPKVKVRGLPHLEEYRRSRVVPAKKKAGPHCAGPLRISENVHGRHDTFRAGVFPD
jgi:hypothetical protein